MGNYKTTNKSMNQKEKRDVHYVCGKEEDVYE